jgi:hypothetical protein
MNPVIRGWMNYYGKFYRTEMDGPSWRNRPNPAASATMPTVPTYVAVVPGAGT